MLASVRELFGQVLVEGIASGLPAIAVDSHGPADIVDHGETGWLVDADDLAGLTNALVQAVNRPESAAAAATTPTPTFAPATPGRRSPATSHRSTRTSGGWARPAMARLA